jgi:hypothetical protein
MATLRSQRVLTVFTAYHEGGPPPAVPDLVFNSYPRLVVRTLMQGLTRHIENLDKYVRSTLLNVLHSTVSQGATR